MSEGGGGKAQGAGQEGAGVSGSCGEQDPHVPSLGSVPLMTVEMDLAK
jgi:hypothetical protein